MGNSMYPHPSCYPNTGTPVVWRISDTVASNPKKETQHGLH